MTRRKTYKVTFKTGYSDGESYIVVPNDETGDDVLKLARLAADAEPPQYNSFTVETMPVLTVERLADIFM